MAEAAADLEAVDPAGAVEIVLLTPEVAVAAVVVAEVVAVVEDLAVETAAALEAVGRVTSVQAGRTEASLQQMPQAHRKMLLMQTVREVAVPLA